ncbi:UDP-N-acetylglucosamine 2-epimerase (non-hydrolysing) [Alicyclobacillus hesperidum]|uniref:UDP-N-acetylglucosamine 2-epimerase (Non-hydrolysing) n=1 Tax=Alicyclobacillus hesperidum TaxID=89784 RepID=A0A1H2SD02_9BACL|nr:UDP-N-acetylglucosamine 2-epimerase (non-hydrolyzing) [Alicyclobacillus hesperidum]SDW29543.1 UDP-N-acetylglucosamine 2-epimerase (non-hydrolysing) [Alicyclobacillus hesperidum]
MKILTLCGTRPEIIRLSLIIRSLDETLHDHVLVYSGQNHHRLLSGIFFEQLGLRRPDVSLGAHTGTVGSQLGRMFSAFEAVLQTHRPDAVLVLGDTNTALCAIVAERVGIPVYHMEAGNRCYDRSVPEEINRRAIDAVASFNLPYTAMSRDNLLREGIAPHRIWISGNPIYEVLQAYGSQIDKSEVLDRYGLHPRRYIVVTVHRAENVDRVDRLQAIVNALQRVAKRFDVPLVISLHPRTRDRLQHFHIPLADPRFIVIDPLGLFDFVQLQKQAWCVITDSGTVQEECCILHVPAVTIRRSTERPETVLCGSNVVAGHDPEHIASCVEQMANSPRDWACPEGYCDSRVSRKVVQWLTGGLSDV